MSNELDALNLQLAILKNQVEAIPLQAQFQARQSTTRLAQVNAQIDRVQAQIAAIDG